MSVQHHSPTEAALLATRANSTSQPHHPQQEQHAPPPVHHQAHLFLPSARLASGGGTRTTPSSQPFRRPHFEQANARLAATRLPSSTIPRSPSQPHAYTQQQQQQGLSLSASSGLARLAPHSPAVARTSAGASPRQHSASMRGSSAAQRQYSSTYAARSLHYSSVGEFSGERGGAAVHAAAAASASSFPMASPPHEMPDSATTASSPSPRYYVVGSAVVNPQLTVSPSVQGEVRGVGSLAVLPDAQRRPAVGAQLHNTHVHNNTSAPSTSRATLSGTSGNVPKDQHRHDGADKDDLAATSEDVVVCVERVHTRRTTPDHLPYIQLAHDARASSVAVLRQLYGTTGDDVIEVAQMNPRSGLLEPPRLQYHAAQELVPELTSSETQMKAAANARRKIDWDVHIPTAATLPPPVITFTTASGTPASMLSCVAFGVDTSTLVLQRDAAAEKALAAVRPTRSSVDGSSSSSVAAALSLTSAPPSAAASRSAKPARSLFEEEAQVGRAVSRQDRIGSSGLYRIHHLVGLSQGLGEMVGLDRVLEYEVTTSSNELFLTLPSIDAASGDLLMELNTSLQGTAKLTITGVDCGTVDVAQPGGVQRSSNTLTCYITLKHSTSAALASAAAQRERSLISVASDGAPQYARVPSAATRSPSAGAQAGNNANNNNTTTNHSNGVSGAMASGMSAAAFPGSSGAASRDNAVLDGHNSGGFALSLAHFSSEFAAADRPGSHNRSLSREGGVHSNGASDGAVGDSGGGFQHGLDVQGIVARSAARGEHHLGMGVSGTGAGSGGGGVVSGAFTGAGHSVARGQTARRGRTSASSRRGGAGTRSHSPASPYLFPLTNPHELRYHQCTDAARLCRVQYYAQQREQQRRAEVQRRREAVLNSIHNNNNNNNTSTSVSTMNNNVTFNAESSMTTSQQRNLGVRHHATGWSDDDDDQELSRETSEESPGRRPSSAATATSGAAASTGNKRSRRKSVVEILELEEEYDHTNPVAMPTMTGLFSQSATQSVTAGLRPNNSSQRLQSDARGSTSHHSTGSDSMSDNEALMRALRVPRIPLSLFSMNTMQTPVSYLRLTVWQDRLILLFTEEDRELLRNDNRARFKRAARLELTEGALAGMLSSTFAWGGMSSASLGSRKLSMQGRRSSAVFSARHLSSVSGGGGGGGGGDSGPTSTSPSRGSNATRMGNGEAGRNNSGSSNAHNNMSGSSSNGLAAERSFAMMRRLVLCLALEEERSSVQLYADVAQLCTHLCHSALHKTMSLTRGTREGLQQAAAAVLASGSPVTSPRGKRVSSWEGTSSFSAADRQALRLLSETLELAMTVTLLIGAYGSAVEYAVQRVHALCLLEGDTTAVVNAAQRDLVETYLFYGDYATAVTIAEDVVMLTEQLCPESPDAYEVAEAEALCTLACIAANRHDRLRHYVARLEANVLPMEGELSGATRLPQPLLQAQLRLVLGYARTYEACCGYGGSSGVGAPITAAVVRAAREAVHLLRGEGDLQEMEQSFSTVFPSQARLLANLDASNTNIPLALRGRLASAASCNIASGQQVTNRSFGELNSTETAAKMMSAQKRLRWNLLSFAGALLLEHGEVHEGIAVMENTVKELVLGQHRYVERTHRSSIAAVLWVGLVLSKAWVQPAAKEDYTLMLKEVVSRVVRIAGPLHPFAAAANLKYANAAFMSRYSRHGLSLVSRSLSVLESALSPQSHYILIAHYVYAMMAESQQQRWRPTLEHFSAAYALAQAGHLCDDVLRQLETRFIGALLSCPPTAVVDLDVTALRASVTGRLARLRTATNGDVSEALVEALCNVAEVHHLLHQHASAEACVREAIQLLDRRGLLLSSADVLRPVDTLRLEHQHQQQQQRMSSVQGSNNHSEVSAAVAHLIERRNAAVHNAFDSVQYALLFATTLHMLGAVCETQARTTEACERYGQCLAVLEALQLGETSLPAARVMSAMARLLYTSGNCGDALAWANRAERLLYTHYRKQWPMELENAAKLVSIVERRLYEEEGTYVVQGDAASPDELPRLL